MESLSMKTLASSLPASGNAASEKQLMDNFKAAALSITTLYRSSLDASKQAYSSGYVACLKDILQFVQAGVCTVGDAGGDGREGEHGMMTIGRVMDWVEARLEAIKCTDEEEEEERANRESGPSADTGSTAFGSAQQQQRSKDEKEKDTRRRPQVPSSSHNTSTQQTREGPSSSSFSKARSNRANKDPMPDPQPSSSSPRHSHSVSPAPPSYPAATVLSSPSPPPQLGPALRSSTRSKRNTGAAAMSPVLSTVSIPAPPHPHAHIHHESSQLQTTPLEMIPPSSASAFTFAPEVVTALPPVSVTAAVAGTKRRHAMIAAAAAFAAGGGAVAVDPSGGGVGGDDTSSNSSTNSTPNGGPHAHGRGSRRRGGHYNRGKVASENPLQIQNGYDSMDVEEDGRERKRIARR